MITTRALMVLNNVSPKLTRVVGRKSLVVKKNAPHIFFVGGIVGVVGSTVLACRATLKLTDTLDEIEKDIEQARGTDEDLTRAYIRSGAKLGRLYGPAVGVGVVSIGALSGAHINLTRRNTALMAAYTALQTFHESYRDRVRDELGSVRELDLHQGVVETKNDDGEIAKLRDPNGLSPYARMFDEYSSSWTKDPEINRIFVKCQQDYMNDLLRARGHVFLNDVYDALGIERSRAGAVVGWLMNGEGDSYVDFGIFDPSNSPFVNGWETSVLLDFNVDGVIYDKI